MFNEDDEQLRTLQTMNEKDDMHGFNSAPKLQEDEEAQSNNINEMNDIKSAIASTLNHNWTMISNILSKKNHTELKTKEKNSIDISSQNSQKNSQKNSID